MITKTEQKKQSTSVSRNKGQAYPAAINKKIREYFDFKGLTKPDRELTLHILGSYWQTLSPVPCCWDWVEREFKRKTSLRRLVDLGVICSRRMDVNECFTGHSYIGINHQNEHSSQTYSKDRGKSKQYIPSQEVLDIIFSFELQDWLTPVQYYGSWIDAKRPNKNNFRGLPDDNVVVQHIKSIKPCPINLKTGLEYLKQQWLEVQESWDDKLVAQFYQNIRSFKTIVRYSNPHPDKQGFILYQATYSVATTGRRIENGGGLQTVKREFRKALITNNGYQDFDIVASQLTIIRDLMRKFNIPCEYLDNIKAFRQPLIDWLGKDLAKNCIYTLCFGGSAEEEYRYKNDEGWLVTKKTSLFNYLGSKERVIKFSELAADFIDDLNKLDFILKSAYKSLGDDLTNAIGLSIRDIKKDKTNIDKKFIRAFVIQGIETLNLCTWTTKRENVVVVADLHDGYCGLGEKGGIVESGLGRVGILREDMRLGVDNLGRVYLVEVNNTLYKTVGFYQYYKSTTNSYQASQ